jgi:hypothetical protein
MREHRVPLGHVRVTTLSHMYARACAACVTHQADSTSQANTWGRLHPAVGEVQETQARYVLPSHKPDQAICHALNDSHHYRNRRLCRVPKAVLGKVLKTLGKLFAECRTRQRGLDIQCIGKAVFAEYFFRTLGKEKQSLRQRVTETESLPSVPDDTRQRS